MVSQNIDTEAKNITSDRGIEYHVRFIRSNLTILIVAKNIDNKPVPTGIGIEVDGQRLVDYSFRMGPGESRKLMGDLNKSVRILRENHTATVSTFGSEANFHWNANYSTPNFIPIPYIKYVDIKNGTIDGEPSAVAEVTVANPSKQTYPTKLMVHTTGTDGSFYPAAVPPGETRTITVELLDERGAKIAGEARLYTEGLNKQEGAMDQVEFVGRAGAETRHWNTTYEPVRPPWVDDSYRYRNTSVTGDGGLVPGETGSWVVYAAAGVVLLVWLVRRFR